MSDPVCHQSVIHDDGDLAPCDRPAVGVRYDFESGYDESEQTYPVCDRHLCGGCGAYHWRCTTLLSPERAILQDLIADLWGMAESSDHLTEWIGPSLEHAEARLKGLNNE